MSARDQLSAMGIGDQASVWTKPREQNVNKNKQKKKTIEINNERTKKTRRRKTVAKKEKNVPNNNNNNPCLRFSEIWSICIK